MRTIFALILLLGMAAWAQGPDCVCPPGGSTMSPTGVSAPPSLGTGHFDGSQPGRSSSGNEDPVGRFSDWANDHPDLAGLADQASKDPALAGVLDQLTPGELTNLGNLLTSYQNGINTYVSQNPRAWDGAPGAMRNMLNSFSGDPFTRGCDDMTAQTITVLGPQTGGTNPFTVHRYRWDPGAGRQFGVYFGAPIGGVVVVQMAGAGTIMGGPLGTAVGATGGLIVALGTRNTEHNMAALRSTRNPDLVIVLDPHAAQNGNPESVHGPDHYNGAFSQPALGPAEVPPSLPAAAQPGNNIQKGTMSR